jgi:hypothetical protein
LALKKARWRRWPLAGLLVAVAGLGRPAVAGSLDYQLGAGVYAGFTDNALGVPNGTPGSASDGLILGRADLGLSLTRQFSEHRLAYAFSASRYVRQSGGDILSNSLAWEAAFQPLTSLRLTSSLGATQGRLTSLDVSSSSASGGTTSGPSGPRPAQALLYASAAARQGLSAELSPRWRLLQSLVVQGFWPLEANTQRPSSYSGDLGVGLERSFVRDGISLNAHGLAMQSNQVSGDSPQPRYRSVVVESDLGWRHTWTPVWSDYISGGGIMIESPAGSGARFQPAGRAELSARRETNEFSLRVERGATPNVFAGDIFLSTRVMANASAGFGKTQKWQLRALASFDRASAIGPAGENRGGATVWLAQAVMTYGAPGPILVSLEYSFTDQHAIAPDSGQTPSFFSFRRNLVMVGIEFKYTSLRPLMGATQQIRGAGNPAEDPRR